ncbi:Xaa-Pro peptidase family protein [Pseudodesulfovibrio sp. zrk46]|uniref:M24 family metallopeptidase n=1 Tax=Pseudodesulfovibrio sp. zrk46 TaxID=2725288 RepID=UPI001449C462|nr:Xaa-Pro peptidase family protein [Pseudodesulfovibrio sp. zrk46]QJB55847.1 aminopeptidase P family protein [Pseudodesulfovibrio sp. zrk46]
MSTNIFEQRRDNLKRLLTDKGIPALLVSHAANRYYLSGFELHDAQCNESTGWLVVTADGDDYLFTDPRYTDAALKVWDEDKLFIYSANKFELVSNTLQGKGIKAMGVEPKALHLFDYDKLNERFTLQSTDNVVEELRIIKDEDEIRRMDASIALNHKLFEYIEGQLEPGKTEEQVAWEVEKFFRENGAEELAFSTIVGVGPNAALPHAIPGQDQLRENDMVLIDTGCRLEDYNSDQTRTFWVGDKQSDRFKETMDLVRAAQQAAIDIIRPGLSYLDAYKASYAVFEKAGVAAMFTHGLGHGIGLETHEPPSLSKAAKGTLKPGMVVTVEPGLYDAKWGGIRWEYQVLVTEDGCRIM